MPSAKPPRAVPGGPIVACGVEREAQAQAEVAMTMLIAAGVMLVRAVDIVLVSLDGAGRDVHAGRPAGDAQVGDLAHVT